jgi:hypothetical protein
LPTHINGTIPGVQFFRHDIDNLCFESFSEVTTTIFFALQKKKKSFEALFIAYNLPTGFSSLFLYRRLYRSHTTLCGFSFDNGTVERKKDLTLEEFYHQYDGKKPVK